ncbi:MAG: class I SAM-dependent methyltransferase [Bacteroidota bacterium]
MAQKDYFSSHSRIYATFRPTYPEKLYQFIFSHLNGQSTAWDCATGNGQVAQRLGKDFEKVFATDISRQQLDEAHQASNIFYSVSSAEQTSFQDNQFDLITVGQALHWFRIDEFYREAKRTAKPHGLLAIWGYALLSIEPAIDELFLDFYHNTAGPYWDSARKLVEGEYCDVPFPFEVIETPKFEIVVQWDLDQFAGYITSWSATQKYIKTLGTNPAVAFSEKLKPYWKAGIQKTVTFPVFMKLGRVVK